MSPQLRTVATVVPTVLAADFACRSLGDWLSKNCDPRTILLNIRKKIDDMTVALAELEEREKCAETGYKELAKSAPLPFASSFKLREQLQECVLFDMSSISHRMADTKSTAFRYTNLHILYTDYLQSHQWKLESICVSEGLEFLRNVKFLEFWCATLDSDVIVSLMSSCDGCSNN